MKLKHLILAIAAASCLQVHAADSINLGSYSVAGTYALDILNGDSGGISGLEASAVTYARDRGTLFFVGDEGTGVVEISLTGQTLGSMNFNWAGTGSSKHDTEGLTYLGGGVLVVGEERLQDAYRFTYVAGGSATLANSGVSISNASVGNSGLEGISYDPRNGGSFVTIKQESPQNVMAGTLTFASGLGGISTMTELFNPTSMNLTTLSDIQTLSPVDKLVGTNAADNLLVLSLGSRMLVEVNRQGVVKSFLDLSGVVPNNGIEGVTVDEKGTIYLVAEQIQDGITLNTKSQLIVLTAPVPEPETYAMLLAGLGLLGFVARRKKKIETAA
ncbi:MAG: SdiA-regulated domain-containing protein [Azonexus sp.]|nr:SdiA-regulated domain-containing protein [Azonexus sp.]